MTLVMAYDFGTTSLKAAVVQHGGRIVADADVSYPVSQPEPGWAELAVEMLWDLAAATGRRALETAGLSGDDISTVVFVAPWKGIVPIGAR
ncbi:carbohydrate kinase, partial [Schumannella luteola]